MGKFRIIGANAETGADVNTVVTADTIHDAEAIASGRGLLISRVVEIEEVSIVVTESPALSARQPPSPVPGQPPFTPTLNINPPRRGSSLGVGSVILGVLGFLICWIPFISVVSMPLTGLGLILAIIGFLVAVGRNGASIGYPIAGGMICVVALLVAYSTGVAPSMALLDDAKKRANAQRDETGQSRSIDATPRRVVSSRPSEAPTAPAQRRIDPTPGIRELKIGDSITDGPLQLTFQNVEIRRVLLSGHAQRHDSEEQFLVLRFGLKNVDPNRFLQQMFTSTSALDDFGNKYESPNFNDEYCVETTIGFVSLRPNQVHHELEVITRPVETAKQLTISVQSWEKTDSWPSTKDVAQFKFRLRIKP